MAFTQHKIIVKVNSVAMAASKKARALKDKSKVSDVSFKASSAIPVASISLDYFDFFTK